jgi:tight adherence protein B
MSSGLAILCVVALLCAATGLLLWQRAHERRERTMTNRFVDRSLQPGAQAQPLASQPGGQAQRQAQSQPQRARAPAPPAGSASGARERVRYEGARLRHEFGNLMSRAGIVNPRALVWTTAAAILCGSLWVAVRIRLPVALAFAAVALLLTYAVLSWRAQKRYQRISRQLPVFLDGIVRLVTIGNSVPAAFQSALINTEMPLRECLDRVSQMLRAGVEIDHALTHVAGVYHVRDLEMIGSVLRISVKYGGRSDVMLDRMASLMRDLEQANRELVAMSTETRLSSWVLAVLPVLLGGYVIVANPAYFDAMWRDPAGHRLVFVAGGLQVFGAFLLYRLAKLRT